MAPPTLRIETQDVEAAMTLMAMANGRSYMKKSGNHNKIVGLVNKMDGSYYHVYPAAGPMAPPQAMFGTQPVVVPQAILENLQVQVTTIQEQFASQQQLCARLYGTVKEISSLNAELYGCVGELRERVSKLEKDNARLQGMGGRTRNLSNLSVSVSQNGVRVPYMAALPTPATPSQMPTPRSGVPPAFPISPANPKTPTTPGGTKKSQTSLHKKGMHNLGSLLPAPNVQLPIVPLTDVELIVFFFNHASRPIVAMRLYGRNWGPAGIANVINEYRLVEPHPYERNTCSVKCSTAIKRGETKEGSDWKPYWTNFFLDADDASATDVIRLKDEEEHEAQDIHTNDLLKSLIKYPEGEGAGVFTAAIKWCEANDHHVPLSMIPKVVIALEQGDDPSLYLEVDPHKAMETGTDDADESQSCSESSSAESSADASVSEDGSKVSCVAAHMSNVKVSDDDGDDVFD